MADQLKQDAEKRALAVANERSEKEQKAKKSSAARYSASDFSDTTIFYAGNPTPAIAKIAAVDYKLNGSRARSSSGEFVGG